MTHQVIFGAIFGLLDILLSIDAFANWFFEKVKLLKKKSAPYSIYNMKSA